MGDFLFNLAVVAYFVLVPLSLLLSAQPLVHIFQLESYKRPQFFLRLREDKSPVQKLIRAWVAAALVFLVLLAGCAAAVLLSGSAGFSPPADSGDGLGFGLFLVAISVYFLTSLAAGLVFIVFQSAVFFRWKRLPSKKPLKVTSRVVRLDIAFYLVLLITVCLCSAISVFIWLIALSPLIVGGVIGGAMALPAGILAMLVACGVLGMLFQLVPAVLVPRLLALASLLVQPVEKAVQNWYLNDARKKLAGFPDLIKIGITGSYGKTSAKVILATILSEKYKTYATPHSYNTPMGVTRAIREQLDAGHQVFIAEMGARHRGDIADLCRLVRPKYGLITSIGPQHLETMFNIETIAKTKYELIEALPPDGMGFFPCDGGICVDLYQKTTKQKALFGFEGCGEALHMSARDIAHGPQGSSFTLTGPGGETVSCASRLLGKHNVLNILGCAAVARALGLSMEEIARGVAKAEPVEHRLQLIPTGNGVTVIDDAFNSNPAGTRAALEVLGDFPGRKIVVTPGMVELGEAEAAENEAFGRAMAPVVDIAILVARNAPTMKKGLLEAGFPEENLIVVGKLAEATTALGSLTRVGDVVLFENDLPDHYEI